MPKGKKYYYAISSGKGKGIYNHWEKFIKAKGNDTNVVWASFVTKEEAMEWMISRGVHPVSSPKKDKKTTVRIRMSEAVLKALQKACDDNHISMEAAVTEAMKDMTNKLLADPASVTAVCNKSLAFCDN